MELRATQNSWPQYRETKLSHFMVIFIFIYLSSHLSLSFMLIRNLLLFLVYLHYILIFFIVSVYLHFILVFLVCLLYIFTNILC
jgi:hypothetical protein